MDHKILDLNFFEPRVIASHLIETSEGPVLIETGPDNVASNLEKALNENGYALEDLKHVFVTHIHLDHSGGAWRFAKKGATIYVHPKGAKHLVNPERLLASAKIVFGDKLESLFGYTKGIDEDRIKVVEDGDVVTIGGVSIKVVETLGHASHHHSYMVGDWMMIGDVGGVRIDDGPIIPPTPAPDINVEAWLASMKKVVEINPSAISPTHYGTFTDVREHFQALEAVLLEHTEWMGARLKEGLGKEELTALYAEVDAQVIIDAGAQSIRSKYEFANPFWMNAGGLIRYWKKFRLAE